MKVIDLDAHRKQSDAMKTLILSDDFERVFYESAKICAAIYRDQCVDWQNIETMMVEMVIFATLEKHSEEVAERGDSTT